MRWMLGTLLASSHRPRLRPPELFGEGVPKLAQEEVKALAGVWTTQIEFEDRYDADISLYLESSGRVVPMDDELPYNLCVGSHGWSWWCADRSVMAGTEGDDKLSLSLQLGHLRFEGHGKREDFRCSEFVGEVVYEGADADPVGHFSMQLRLPIKSNVSALEERYQQRIAARPPPPPSFPFSDFIGRWFMGLSEDDSPGTVFFPVEILEDGSWFSKQTMPKLSGKWGVCSSAAASHGGGPDVQSTGTNLWLTFDSARGANIHLQGKPVPKPAEAAEAAEAAEGDARLPVADQVDGQMWEGEEVRDYFGTFRLLRESALAEILLAAKAAHAPAGTVGTAPEAEEAVAMMEEEEASWMYEEEAAAAMMGEEEVLSSWVYEEDEQAEMVPDLEVMARMRQNREQEAKREWLASRGLDVPLWGHGR